MPERCVVTTDSRHTLPVAENLLGRQFGVRDAGCEMEWGYFVSMDGEGWLSASVRHPIRSAADRVRLYRSLDNRKRRHSALGYLSPDAFERQYQQQQVKAFAA